MEYFVIYCCKITCALVFCPTQRQERLHFSVTLSKRQYDAPCLQVNFISWQMGLFSYTQSIKARKHNTYTIKLYMCCVILLWLLKMVCGSQCVILCEKLDQMAFWVVKAANHWSRWLWSMKVFPSSPLKLCIQYLFAGNNKQNSSYLQLSMIWREGAPATREQTQKRKKKQRVSGFTGMTSLCVTLWGNSLDSGHQHENKLSFTHPHSAGNGAHSHVAKLDATGLET